MYINVSTLVPYLVPGTYSTTTAWHVFRSTLTSATDLKNISVLCSHPTAKMATKDVEANTAGNEEPAGKKTFCAFLKTPTSYKSRFSHFSIISALSGFSVLASCGLFCVLSANSVMSLLSVVRLHTT